MIIAPSETLWTPRQGPWWRRPRPSLADFLALFTEGKIQRDPTTGKVKRHASSGKAVRNSAAALGCCCGEFIRAKKCSDSTYADLWFRYDSGSATIETTVGPLTVLPFYFIKAGVAYKVESTHTINGTGGTLASAYTVADECPNGIPCAACPETPSELTVTFAGVTICACVQAGPNNMYGKKIELNGTYCLAQTASACIYKTTVTASILQFWFNAGGISSCAGAPTGDLGDTDIFVEFTIGLSTVWARHASASVLLFSGTKAISNCLDSHVANNAVGGCGTSFGAFSLVVGTGGTATVSNGC